MPKQPKKMIELYQFEQCPYCKNVRLALIELGLSYINHNVPFDQDKRDAVEKISAQRAVPVLVDPNTDTIIADDDDKAVAYLKKQYG